MAPPSTTLKAGQTYYVAGRRVETREHDPGPVMDDPRFQDIRLLDFIQRKESGEKLGLEDLPADLQQLFQDFMETFNPYGERKATIPADDIHAARPKEDKVTVFESEESAMNWANSQIPRSTEGGKNPTIFEIQMDRDYTVEEWEHRDVRARLPFPGMPKNSVDFARGVSLRVGEDFHFTRGFVAGYENTPYIFPTEPTAAPITPLDPEIKPAVLSQLGDLLQEIRREEQPAAGVQKFSAAYSKMERVQAVGALIDVVEGNKPALEAKQRDVLKDGKIGTGLETVAREQGYDSVDKLLDGVEAAAGKAEVLRPHD